MQTGQNIQVFAEWLHRFPDEREFVRQYADFLGDPVAWCRAVWHEAAEETWRCVRRSLCLCRHGRDHCIQQRKGKRGADSAQHGATVDVLFGDEHGFIPPSSNLRLTAKLRLTSCSW